MEELNIKCYNKKEAEFIEKYFSDKGYNWTYKNSLSFKNKKFNNFPIVIWNFKNYEGKLGISWSPFNDWIIDEYVFATEAKHLIRKEKLNRINKD